MPDDTAALDCPARIRQSDYAGSWFEDCGGNLVFPGSRPMLPDERATATCAECGASFTVLRDPDGMALVVEAEADPEDLEPGEEVPANGPRPGDPDMAKVLQVCQESDLLRAINADLLAALKRALPYVPTDGDAERDVREAIEDAIAKAGA